VNGSAKQCANYLQGGKTMANYNKIFLMGNITADIDLRYTPNGIPVARFSVAVNQFYKDAEGQQKQSVDFIPVVVFSRQAEACSQYLGKGSPVFVEGRLTIRDYVDKEGNKRRAAEVRARRVIFMPKRRAGEAGAAVPPAAEPEKVDEVVEELADTEVDDDIPF
jgi:single-strand DNA-binding protein